MKSAIILGCCMLLPIASSYITYIVIAGKTDPIALDATQGVLLSLALIKLVLLGSLGVFPIHLDTVFTQVLGDEEYRPRRSLHNSTDLAVSWRYKEIPVHKIPCLRRMFCEIETAAKTSDSYGNEPSQNDVDRHLEEEMDVESPDPLLEMYTEAVRALYGYDGPSAPDSSPATEKALSLMQSLTGKSCEQAYKLCSGRYTAPMVFGKIFTELNIRLKDEL
ncbi:hypothetical protein FHG87_001725 [Trinorchestia longiramus]|nr:hypothetical protein FHG87_001725 [Trinorchestia longiramus]